MTPLLVENKSDKIFLLVENECDRSLPLDYSVQILLTEGCLVKTIVTLRKFKQGKLWIISRNV